MNSFLLFFQAAEVLAPVVLAPEVLAPVVLAPEVQVSEAQVLEVPEIKEVLEVHQEEKARGAKPYLL